MKRKHYASARSMKRALYRKWLRTNGAWPPPLFAKVSERLRNEAANRLLHIEELMTLIAKAKAEGPQP